MFLEHPRLRAAILALPLILAAGCGGSAVFVAEPEVTRIGREVQKGKASYYHDSLHGNPTASGEPYDRNAEQHLSEVSRFSMPQPGFKGQDFLHTMAADSQGYALAGMINPQLDGGLGLYLRFRADNLPYLNEWKMLDEGDYVTGIEPVNTKTVGRGTLRKENRLPWLEPGETREMEVEIGVLEGMPEIEDFSARIRKVLSREQTIDPI